MSPIGFGQTQSSLLLDMPNPIGTITAWSGALVDVPFNWQLCDGTNGTPDLRNKFLVGAGDTYAVDEAGGALAHDHAFDDGGHTHGFTSADHDHGAKASIRTSDVGAFEAWDFDSPNNQTTNEQAEGTTDSQAAAGTTGSGSNLPPFYSLAWIQRMA